MSEKAPWDDDTEVAPWDQGSSHWDQLKQVGKNALGGVDAALNMTASVPSYAYSGLAGMGQLMMGNGIDAAGNAVRNTQESNFGMGKPKTFTPEGEQVLGMVGDLSQKGIQKAGQGGYALGGELGRTNAEIAAEALLNFMPIPGGKGVSKLAKMFESEKPKVTPANAKEAALDKMENVPKEAAPWDEIPNLKSTEGFDKQTNLFDQFDETQGRQNQFQADPNTAVWRTDENGIPVRADLSMEANNVQAPLQKNIWGDELGPKTEQEAKPVTQAMDETRNAAQNATELPEAVQQRDLMNTQSNLFKGEIDAPGELKSAAMEANGWKIPNSQRGAINTEVFQKGFEKLKDLGNGISLRAFGTGSDLRIQALRGKNEIGLTVFDSVPDIQVASKYPDVVKNMPADKSYIESFNTGVNRAERNQGLATEMYKFAAELGNDIKPSGTQTTQGRMMWDGFEKNSVSKNGIIYSPSGKQQGGINIDAIKGAADKAVDALNDGIKRVSNFTFDPQQRFSEYMGKNIPGFAEVLKDKFAKPEPIEQTIQKTVGTQDTAPIWKWNQSGPDLTAAKFGEHPLLVGVSRQLNYAYKNSELQIRQLVSPLKKYISTLATREVKDIHSLFLKEMFQEKRFTEEQLLAAGYSAKQVNAYKMFRGAMDEMLKTQNEGRQLLGKDPVTAKDAYYSSIWHGDYHVPILDKDGRLAWYIRTTTKAEAAKAIQYLKEKMGDSLKIDNKTVPEFRGSRRNPTTPPDVIGAYHDMLGFFSDTPEISSQIKEALQGYMTEKGYTIAGQNKHFLEKSNVRGFVGDRPWLSEKENAYAGMRAQMEYMTNGIRWAQMQEAIGNIKKVLSDPQVIEKAPNAVSYAKSIVAKSIGIDHNLFSPIETALAKIVPASLNPIKLFDKNNYGVSKGSLYTATADIKTLTYLQMLGASPAYMIATPLQAVMTVPMWHRILTNEGLSHNVGKTSVLALSDTLSGILSHIIHEAGKDNTTPMTAMGKEALKYAEDSSIISKNIFDESSGLNEHPAMANAHAAMSWTIGFPEKVARLGSFMSFVHHLEASGKFTDKLELFRKAEELSDRAMTSFKTFDRPQIVENFGASGHMAYTFKSFLFNAFNNLSVASRMAADGKPTPLLIMVGMYALMGGIQNAPVINEMDALWNATKDLVANIAPAQYSKLKAVDNGNGIKGNLISMLPESSGLRDLFGYGAPSAATGIQLASRMNMATGIDPEHPTSNVAPILQEIKEQSALAHAVLNPTSKDAWMQAAWVNAPPLIKGQLETNTDAFKVGNTPGNQGYLKPNDLLNPQMMGHRRTEFDETMKKWGMTSLAEARDKDTQYIANKEQKRITTVLEGLTARMMSGVKNKDAAKVGDSAIEYLKFNPDTKALESALQKGIMDMNTTPIERKEMYLQTIQQINQYMRYQKMQK